MSSTPKVVSIVDNRWIKGPNIDLTIGWKDIFLVGVGATFLIMGPEKFIEYVLKYTGYLIGVSLKVVSNNLPIIVKEGTDLLVQTIPELTKALAQNTGTIVKGITSIIDITIPALLTGVADNIGPITKTFTSITFNIAKQTPDIVVNAFGGIFDSVLDFVDPGHKVLRSKEIFEHKDYPIVWDIHDEDYYKTHYTINPDIYDKTVYDPTYNVTKPIPPVYHTGEDIDLFQIKAAEYRKKFEEWKIGYDMWFMKKKSI